MNFGYTENTENPSYAFKLARLLLYNSPNMRPFIKRPEGGVNKMGKDKTKKKWEKPELRKLGLEMEHCCVIGGASPARLTVDPDNDPTKQ